MATGKEIVRLAETRLGETYRNVLVPKDNPKWHGPWDCAEFASWVAFQVLGKLYGCTNNAGNPATTESYSGAWVRDASNGTLISVSESAALSTPGIILIRRPPMVGAMGHVAIADGKGKTVEAAGVGLGVRRGAIAGRLWHFYAQLPGVEGSSTPPLVAPSAVPLHLTLEEPNISGALVRKVQLALRAAGFDPGKIDSQYGPHTVAAVHAFQLANRLVPDGIVGPRTALKLGVEWPR